MRLLNSSSRAVAVLIGAGLLLPLSAGSLQAKDKKADKKPKDRTAVFATLDKDGSKELSLSEFVGAKTGKKEEQAKATFTKRDKNADGKLSLDEFTAKAEKKPKAK